MWELICTYRFKVSSRINHEVINTIKHTFSWMVAFHKAEEMSTSSAFSECLMHGLLQKASLHYNRVAIGYTI